MVYRRGGGMAAEAVVTDFYVCPIHKPSSVYHDYISVEDLVRRIRGFGLELQRFMSLLLRQNVCGLRTTSADIFCRRGGLNPCKKSFWGCLFSDQLKNSSQPHRPNPTVGLFPASDRPSPISDLPPTPPSQPTVDLSPSTYLRSSPILHNRRSSQT
ncbi:hypothetical protein E3N88_04093 [Mikania micrantha]|uniref:Uncharacterized protein n=1 Tax=Mikania micrantha TaxID=192012 RepID=A0A5N6PTF3_9ASTR|nr:hypothetical protein E3N88_04093 [Mikania micrantha]